MAINGRFRVSMEDVFPHGAYVVSEVEPVRDFDKSTRERMVQQVDRDSGLPVWSVSVLDADPAARRLYATRPRLSSRYGVMTKPSNSTAGNGIPAAASGGTG